MDSGDDEDVHQCGRCKQLFLVLEEYLAHKKTKSCQKAHSPSRYLLNFKEPQIVLNKDVNLDKESRNLDRSATWSKNRDFTDTLDTDSLEQDGPPPPAVQRTLTSVAETLLMDVQQGGNKAVQDTPPAPPVKRGRGRPRKTEAEKLQTRLNYFNKMNAKKIQKRPYNKRQKQPVVSKKAEVKEPEYDGDEVDDNDRDDDDEGFDPDYKPDEDPEQSKSFVLKTLVKESVSSLFETERVEGAEKYLCKICNRASTYKDELARHLRRAHGICKYMCERCGSSFRDNYKLKRHMMTKICKERAMLNSSQSGASSTPVKTAVLNDTVESIDQEQSPDQEMAGNHASPDQPDGSPEEITRDVVQFPKQLFLKKKKKWSFRKHAVEFKCAICVSVFNRYEDIVSHITEHPNCYPGICRFCGKWFVSRYKLWRHVTSSVHDNLTDVEIRQFKREVARQRIKCDSKIRSRFPVTADKRFQCTECDQAFHTRSGLDCHVREMHYSFKLKNYFFHCDSCQKTFYKRQHLLAHLLEVHGIQDTQADTCYCPICKKKFKQKSHIFRHRETLHAPQIHIVIEDSKKIEATLFESIEKENLMKQNLQLTQKDMLYQCFVCFQTVAGKVGYLHHLQQHRVWILKSVVKASVENGALFGSLVDNVMEQERRGYRELQRSPNSDTAYIFQEQKESAIVSCQNEESFDSPLKEQQNDSHAENTVEPITSIQDNECLKGKEDPSKSDISAETLEHSESENTSSDRQYCRESESGIMSQNVENQNEPSSSHGDINADHEEDKSSHDPEVQNPEECDLEDDSHIGSHHDNPDGSVGPAVNVQERSCLLCNSTFSSLSDLYNHKYETHDMMPVFRCIKDSCKRIFQFTVEYKQHSEIHSQASFICKLCNDHFETLSEAVIHKNTSHKIDQDMETTRCNVCYKVFTTKEDLQEHVATGLHHHQCSVCGKVFKCPRDLGVHELRHKGIRSFLCDICGATFYSKMSLNRHRSTHNPNKDFKCPECDKAFNKREHMKRHVKTKHSDYAPFKCTYEGCPRAFKRRDKLTEHLRTHSVVKPYMCEVCGKGFRNRDGLKYHEKSHSGSLDHICSMCFIGFSKPSQLNSHLKEVHSITTKNKSVSPCNICDAVFPSLQHLNKHLEQEHGIMINSTVNHNKTQCNICSKWFATTKSLRVHIRRHHTPLGANNNIDESEQNVQVVDYSQKSQQEALLNSLEVLKQKAHNSTWFVDMPEQHGHAEHHHSHSHPHHMMEPLSSLTPASSISLQGVLRSAGEVLNAHEPHLPMGITGMPLSFTPAAIAPYLNVAPNNIDQHKRL